MYLCMYVCFTRIQTYTPRQQTQILGSDAIKTIMSCYFEVHMMNTSFLVIPETKSNMARLRPWENAYGGNFLPTELLFSFLFYMVSDYMESDCKCLNR